MIVLAIDTSGKVCSAAVASEEKLLSEIYVNYGMTHSEMLMPIIDKALEYAHVQIEDISRFAVVNGPGSFTGVRIGVCAVKGLAHAMDKPIVGINALDLLYENVKVFNGVVCPIMDARRSQIYGAVFEKGEKIVSDIACDIDEFLSKINAEKALFLGDGVSVLKNHIEDNFQGALFAEQNLLLQRASAACKLALRENMLLNYKEIQPYYLRESSAEQKANKRND